MPGVRQGTYTLSLLRRWRCSAGEIAGCFYGKHAHSQLCLKARDCLLSVGCGVRTAHNWALHIMADSGRKDSRGWSSLGELAWIILTKTGETK